MCNIIVHYNSSMWNWFRAKSMFFVFLRSLDKCVKLNLSVHNILQSWAKATLERYFMPAIAQSPYRDVRVFSYYLWLCYANEINWFLPYTTSDFVCLLGKYTTHICCYCYKKLCSTIISKHILEVIRSYSLLV